MLLQVAEESVCRYVVDCLALPDVIQTPDVLQLNGLHKLVQDVAWGTAPMRHGVCPCLL